MKAKVMYEGGRQRKTFLAKTEYAMTKMPVTLS